ncbi:MAG TPA: hypothetical protein VMT00_07945 [Thermoanaerobaculia bacterium]|nr:hypothetical protein [Thermoanaerobaculia bacterium]
MNRLINRFGVAVLGLLFVAGCGSTGIGDILGGGSPTTSSVRELRGTVDQVDTSSRSLLLSNVDQLYANELRNTTRNVRVYFDDRTPVTYQGATYRPQDLERGDQISVRINQSGDRLIADSITVLHNVSSGTTSSSSMSSTLRGTVRYVDTSRRTIELEQASWITRFNAGTGSRSSAILQYDTNTSVEYQGRSYPPGNLERGDLVDVQVQELGTGLLAQRIVLVRDARAGF